MRGQNPRVRKHMDRFSWCSVPRMHHCDPGNIEHLYLVTFTLQQLFTLWPLTWSFLWIEPLTNAKMEFGLCVPEQSPVSSVTLKMLVFVQQPADRTSTSLAWLQDVVENKLISHYMNWQRRQKIHTGFLNKTCRQRHLFNTSHGGAKITRHN